MDGKEKGGEIRVTWKATAYHMDRDKFACRAALCDDIGKKKKINVSKAGRVGRAGKSSGTVLAVECTNIARQNDQSSYANHKSGDGGSSKFMLHGCGPRAD